MKLLLCLAMSLGLSAILYFYMKQKISNIENRLNTLSDLLQTLTNEFCKGEVKTLSNIPLDSSLYEVNNINESDEEILSETDGETDSGTEYDSESSSEEEPIVDVVSLQSEPKLEEKKIEFIVLNEPEEQVIVHKETKSLEIDLNEPTEVPLIKVSDDDVLGTKHIQVSDDYSKLSLKDLKQKVSDLGGPPLKTKQALLNFLKNKV